MAELASTVDLWSRAFWTGVLPLMAGTAALLLTLIRPAALRSLQEMELRASADLWLALYLFAREAALFLFIGLSMAAALSGLLSVTSLWLAISCAALLLIWLIVRNFLTVETKSLHYWIGAGVVVISFGLSLGQMLLTSPLQLAEQNDSVLLPAQMEPGLIRLFVWESEPYWLVFWSHVLLLAATASTLTHGWLSTMQGILAPLAQDTLVGLRKTFTGLLLLLGAVLAWSTAFDWNALPGFSGHDGMPSLDQVLRWIGLLSLAVWAILHATPVIKRWNAWIPSLWLAASVAVILFSQVGRGS